MPFSSFKLNVKYTVNGLRLQANVASAVLTQIEQECTCSVPKVYMQCRLNSPQIRLVLTCLHKKSILNGFCVGVLHKETKKETKTLGEI